jgi:hypothetical protein
VAKTKQEITDATAALRAIDPVSLGPDDWRNVSIAAKAAGVPEEIWDEWNRRDPELYDKRKNTQRWESFSEHRDGEQKEITKSTLFWYANSYPILENLPDVDAGKIPTLEEIRALHRAPADQIREYLKIHEPGDLVTIALKGTPKKKDPNKYDPFLTGELYRVGDLAEDPTPILNRANPKIGAWVTINTIDPEKWKAGHDYKAYRTFRYVLIECDEMEPDKQLETAARLNLPVAAIVWSGGRSYHLICRVDAGDLKEYGERARFLIGTCRANGLPADTNNSNVGRLSRLPGVMRNGDEQTFIAVASNPESYHEWLRFIAAKRSDKALKSKHAATTNTTATTTQAAKPGTISSKLEALKEADSPLFGAIGWDEMQKDIAIRRPDLLPWKHEGPFYGPTDEPYAKRYVQDVTGGCSGDTLNDVLMIIAMDNSFNPFIEKLEQVTWDGKDHSGYLFEYYLGAEPCDYVRAVSRLFVREIVCRVLKPGIQADYTPVLKSTQEGIGKTTFCRQMALGDPRYYVSLTSIREPKQTSENMRGKIICDLEEAQALRQRGVTPDMANSWLTNTTDTYRAAYARKAADWPRTACTIITCNSTDWLDQVGQARRFMVVECGIHSDHLPLMNRRPDTLDSMQRFILQAYAQELKGVSDYRSAHDGRYPPLILPPQFADDARKALETVQISDAVTDTVMGCLEDKEAEADRQLKAIRVSAMSLMVDGLGMEEDEAFQNRTMQRKITQILDRKAIGWKQIGRQRIQIGKNSRTQICWEYRGLKPGNGPAGTATTTNND